MVNRLALAGILLFSLASVLAQPPAIGQNGVVNAASQIPTRLPGGALSPGARFMIYGVRFAPGVPSVKVGTVVATVLSVKPKAVEAMLPLDAPLGRMALSVTRDGESSLSLAVEVVRNAPGLYSINGKGWGPGKIFRRGQRVFVQGTGFDPGHAEIFVAGKSARVIAVHRTTQPGIEEIEFEPPKDAPEGCFVPVSAGGLSNMVTMAIGGSKCQAAMPVLNGSKVGFVLLSRSLVKAGPSGEEFTSDDLAATFLQRDEPGNVIAPLLLAPPRGSCTVYTGSHQSGVELSSSLASLLLNGVMGRGLRAAPGLTIRGGSETKQIGVSPGEAGSYWARLGGVSPMSPRRPLPLFFKSGEYRIEAAAGDEVGAFTLALASPRPFVWTDRESHASVDRRKDLTLTWRGGAAGHTMAIIASSVDVPAAAGAVCYCTADAGAGRFTIPAGVLARLPETTESAGPPQSFLLLMTGARAAPLHTAGLDSGFGISLFVNAAPATYYHSK